MTTNRYEFRLTEPFIVDKADGERLCAFPAAAAFPVDAGGESFARLFVYFSQTKDDANIPPSVGLRMSDDGGATWPHYQSHEWFPISLAKLADGAIGGPSFVTEMIGGEGSREQRVRWVESPDDGASWNVTEGRLIAPHPMRCVVKGSGRGGFAFTWLQDMGDGVLGAVLYGYYETDTKYRTVWAESADRGVTWTIVSTVAYDPAIGPEGYCEPTVARVADGTLLCVMRIGSNKPLYQSRSVDNGRTWSEPIVLPGPEPELTYSVLPALRALPDGKLVLSYGRPDTRMLLSADGSGRNWTSFATTYEGTTTGYTGLAVCGDNRLFLTGDKGANWHFSFADGFPSPNPFAIWGTFVDIVTM
jgi:hypothetical protein